MKDKSANEMPPKMEWTKGCMSPNRAINNHPLPEYKPTKLTAEECPDEILGKNERSITDKISNVLTICVGAGIVGWFIFFTVLLLISVARH